MKKTEKIEVRLSHEEKTELSKLADEEGRSVSELIRHLVKRYMSLNSGRLPRKIPWLAFVAVGGLAFLAGHLLTYYIAKSHVDERTYSLSARVAQTSTSIYDDSMRVPILLEDGFSQSYVIPREGKDITLEVSVKQTSDGLFKFNTTFCYQEEASCEVFAQPHLILTENDEARMSFETKDGIEVEISVGPN